MNPTNDAKIKVYYDDFLLLRNIFEKNEYEQILLESLNKSGYFLDKGNGIYFKPENENNGQCDAIAPNYQIDFECLIAQDYARFRSDSNLRLEESKYYKVVYSKREIKPQKICYIWNVFNKNMTINDDSIVCNDMLESLKILKNIMHF